MCSGTDRSMTSSQEQNGPGLAIVWIVTIWCPKNQCLTRVTLVKASQRGGADGRVRQQSERRVVPRRRPNNYIFLTLSAQAAQSANAVSVSASSSPDTCRRAQAHRRTTLAAASYIYAVVTPHRSSPPYSLTNTPPTRPRYHPPEATPPPTLLLCSPSHTVRSAPQARFAAQQFTASIRIVGTSGGRCSIDNPAYRSKPHPSQSPTFVEGYIGVCYIDKTLAKHRPKTTFPSASGPRLKRFGCRSDQNIFTLDLVRGQTAQHHKFLSQSCLGHTTKNKHITFR
ncbi:hypothetical protein BU16DRAFT_140850 [Lophium mytilinum]|uniref:Uncharacterized protein n=1 Tax=Lophium mytilinum TaxID=390894 RepID=A0A6A6QHR8_9PEZI|nr:hypothetical protein BU16DRAFT_140850 [Lophium mytilinum]